MKRVKRKPQTKGLSSNLKHHMTPYELLQTDDILKQVYESASSNPALFLAGISYHLRVDFAADYMASVRADYFVFLCREPVITSDHIAKIRLDLVNNVSLREEAFINLLHFLDPHGSY